VSPVKYEMTFYIPEDDILHSHRLENLKSYILIQVIGGKVRREITTRKTKTWMGV
jgi:hypothetical protein